MLNLQQSYLTISGDKVSDLISNLILDQSCVIPAVVTLINNSY